MSNTTQTNSRLPHQEAAAAFQQMVNAQLQRIAELHREMERNERQGLEQAQAAIDELSRAMKEAVAQSARISAEWRALAMQSAEKAQEMFSRFASA
ncbi:MAG: hypothetical protein GYA21_16675 [Myxococcales bacterium]|nr:hypothetical protein [Myxococcales bacterium]